MRTDRSAILIAAITSIAVSLAACSVAAPLRSATSVVPPSVTASSPAPASTATEPIPSTTPLPTPPPAASTTPRPRPTDPSVAPSTASQRPPTVIPVAELHGPFEPIAGLAASYCLKGDCQETPPSPDGLPRASAGLGGSGLSIELPLGTVISAWEVTATRGAAEGSVPEALLGSGRSEPYATLYVAAPDKGDWLLRATIHSGSEDFVDYHWSLRVREPSRPPPMSDVGPPDGLLRAGRQMVTGLEGSFCYQETCGDIGQLPTARISPLLRVPGSASEMTFHLRGGTGFTTWSVAYWDAWDDQGMETMDLAAGGREGATLTATDFQPPPPGDWQVKISVAFRDGGDATYFSHLIVD